MKAWIIRNQDNIENNPLELSEIDIPTISSQDILIKVLACGVCRTDLHILEGDLAWPEDAPYIVLGHQIIGEVVELGSECKNLNVGELVGVGWLGSTCEECRFCRQGRENLCPNSLYTGYNKMGGYCEYTVAREDYVYKLSPFYRNQLISSAPLLCGGIIGYRALKRANLKEGDRLLMIGFGSSAHITMKVAQEMNIDVYVVSRSSDSLKLALAMGAKTAVTSCEEINEDMDGCIIYAPAGELVPEALRSVRYGGRVVCAGIYMSQIPALPYDNTIFHERELTSVESNTRMDGEELLKIAGAKGITANAVEYSFDRLPQALMDLKMGRFSGSAVIRVSEE